MLSEIAVARLRSLARDGSSRLPGQKRERQCGACGLWVGGRRLRCTCGGKLKGKIRWRCRLCDSDLPPRRQSWCGEECKDAYFMATSSSYLRAKVFERDKGVCAACTLDCQAVEDRLWSMPHAARPKAFEYLRSLGFDVGPGYNGRVTLWDADHIEALAEGGSNYELDNVQTLCQPCHKKKTAEHAARRGKQRRIMGRKWVAQRKAEKRF